MRTMNGRDEDGGQKLDWKDYLALFIALLQTVGLPILILILMILAALVILRLLQ
jgi:hypothetical protein